MEPSARPMTFEDDGMVSVREFAVALFLQKWSMLAVLLGVLSFTAFLVYYFITPTYEAEGTLIINPSNQVLPYVEITPRSDLEKLTAFQTQKEVISSRVIATAVVDHLQLDKKRVLSNFEKLRLSIRSVRRWAGRSFGIESWQKPEDPRAMSVQAVLDNLQILSRGDSMAVMLKYRARDPEEAAATLKALMDEWRRFFYDLERRRAGNLIRYLEDRLESVRRELRDTEIDFVRFKEGDTVPVEGTVAASTGHRAGRKVSATVAEITDSANARSELKTYILQMEEELRKLRAQYADIHPAVVALREKITRFVETMNAVPRKELRLLRLSRDLDLHQKVLVLLRENLEKAKMVEAGDTDKLGIVTVIAYPVAPTEPVGPRKRLAMVAAAIFGALLGVVWALSLDYLDHSIKSVRDVERYLGLRTIGSLRIV